MLYKLMFHIFLNFSISLTSFKPSDGAKDFAKAGSVLKLLSGNMGRGDRIVAKFLLNSGR